MITLDTTRLALTGLGYVGLPPAAARGRRLPARGLSSNAARVAEP